MAGSFGNDFGDDFDIYGEVAPALDLSSRAIRLNDLAGPHVARVWFLDADLPAGRSFFHNGVGNVEMGVRTWTGVTDPVGGQFVALDAVESPRFGQAAAVSITLAAPSAEFWRSVKALARETEGRRGDLYWAAYDPETEQLVLGPFKLFPGKLSRPSLRRAMSLRIVQVLIESLWQAQNFPFGGRWSPAGQEERYPGDLGLQFVGVKVTETFK